MLYKYGFDITFILYHCIAGGAPCYYRGTAGTPVPFPHMTYLLPWLTRLQLFTPPVLIRAVGVLIFDEKELQWEVKAGKRESKGTQCKLLVKVWGITLPPQNKTKTRGPLPECALKTHTRETYINSRCSAGMIRWWPQKPWWLWWRLVVYVLV